MQNTIDYNQLVAKLRRAAEQVSQQQNLLSKLDSFGGDGDHGTTMARAMKIMEKAIDDMTAEDCKSLLGNIGWGIMGVDGGATGPLLGMLFQGMAERAEGKNTLDSITLADMFEAGLAAVQKYTRARVGDKTMIDALVPALQAMRTAADTGSDVATTLQKAAEAAQQGAESTRQMQARFGRAKNLGEKSKGEIDPGAMSMALFFQGLAQ